MVLPLGLGHRRIKPVYVSWLFIFSLGLCYFIPTVFEANPVRLIIIAITFLVIAPYVEMRTQKAFVFWGVLFFSLVSGRLLGLSNHFMELFAGASWLLGCYLGLFAQRKFKISLWFIVFRKDFLVDTYKAVPIIFTVMWWAYIYTGDYNLSGPLKVSLLAPKLMPILAYMVGVPCGKIYKQLKHLPTGFLYDFEWRRWQQVIKRQYTIEKIVRIASVILEINSENFKVRFDVCKKIITEIKGEGPLDKDVRKFFVKNLSQLLRFFIKENRIEAGIDLLLSIPIEENFQRIFARLAGSNLLTFGKIAEKRSMTLLAIVLYSAFLEKNHTSSAAKEVLRNLDYLIAAEIETSIYIDDLEYIEAHSTHEPLKELFHQHIQFAKTAVITTVNE